MGRFDELKQTAKLAKTVWDANEQWARIVAIEGRTGPFARIRLEIHLEGREPYEHVASTVIPRDVQPEVGQDVAIVNRTGPGASSPSWGIKWHKQPQYGYELDAKPMSQEIVAGVMQAQEQVAQAWVGGNPASTSPPPPDPTERAARLARLREQGVITPTEYDEAMAQVPVAQETAAPAAPLPLIGPTDARSAELFRPTPLGEPIPPFPAAAPAPAAPSLDDTGRAARLAQLRAQRVISPEEYERAMAQLQQPPGT